MFASLATVLLVLVPITSQQFVSFLPISRSNELQYRDSFYSNTDPYGSLYANFQDLQKRVEKLEEQVVGLQHAAHQDWNATDGGSMFKLFEERKNWENAEVGRRFIFIFGKPEMAQTLDNFRNIAVR